MIIEIIDHDSAFLNGVYFETLINMGSLAQLIVMFINEYIVAIVRVVRQYQAVGCHY